MKQILDVCCGSKMFYFDKTNSNIIFMDKRKEKDILCDGRVLEVNPDIIGDFKKIPFSGNSFSLVIFDPPHLKWAGQNSWLRKKYGQLPKEWKDELKIGFDECYRVLKPQGTLIFKWSEAQIKLTEVLSCFSKKPLLGAKTTKNSHFLVFYKEN